MNPSTLPTDVIDSPFEISIDLREKLAFDFSAIRGDQKERNKRINVRIRREHLITGDYSIFGWHNRVAIERKSHPDIYQTLGQHRDRFEKEMNRLNELEFAAVVLECSWDELLTPPKYSELNPKTVYRTILAWMVRYPKVHWVTSVAGNGRIFAEKATYRLLERFWKEQEVKGS